MSGKWCIEEFKIEAVKQITDREYQVSEVADRLDVTTKSLYGWDKRCSDTTEQYQSAKQQDGDIRKLKAELRRNLIF